MAPQPALAGLWSRQGVGEFDDASAVNVRHRHVELGCEIPPREVDVLQRGHRALVAGKLCDRMQLPPTTSQIGQAEMAERVGAEPRESGAVSDGPYHL